MGASYNFIVFACLHLADLLPALALLTKPDASVKPLTTGTQGHVQTKTSTKIDSSVVSDAALTTPVWPLPMVTMLTNVRALQAYLPEPEQFQHLPIVNSFLQRMTKSNVHQSPPQPLSGPRGRGESSQDPQVVAGIFLMHYVAFTFFSALCFVGLVLLVAYWYHNEKKFPPSVDGEASTTLEDGAFKYGIFSCFDDLNTCLLSWCCPMIRWADTLRMMGFMQFWAALGLYLGLRVLDIIAMGCASLVLLAICIYYRQKLRERFGMPHGNCGSIFEDCLTYMCCALCAITQEARQAEEAWRAKHSAISGIDV